MVNMQPPKLIYIARRRPDYSPTEFTARWRQHAALGMSQPRWRNVARYLHCDRLAGLLPQRPEVDCDGVAVVVFHSEAARRSHVSEEVSRLTMKADELHTFDRPVAQTTLLTHEKVVKPGSAGDYKLFVFWKADSDEIEFARSWNAAGERWSAHLRSRDEVGLVRNIPVSPRAERMAGLRCDGVDELSARDPMALQILAQSWVSRSRLSATAHMVLTRAVVLHDQPGLPIDPS